MKKHLKRHTHIVRNNGWSALHPRKKKPLYFMASVYPISVLSAFFDRGLWPAISSVAANALYAGYIFSRRGVGVIGKDVSDADTSAAAGSKLEPTTIE